MSIHEVVVPDVGDSRDVEVSELLVAPGSAVAAGEALLVLESDKASVEVTAEVAGTVVAFAVAPGDKVAQGQVLVRIETGAAAPEPAAAAPAPAAVQPATSAAATQANAAAPAGMAAPATQAPAAPATAAATAAASEIEVRVPDLGDAKNVTVSELLANVGDAVKAGQALVVLESDKASMEIEASAAGVLLRYGVKPGDDVADGALIAVLAIAGASAPADAATAGVAPAAAVAAAPPSAPAAVVSEPPAAAAATAQSPAARTPAASDASPSAATIDAAASQVYAGPAVRKMARELGVDLGQVAASGPRGRMVKDDVSRYVKQRLSASPAPAAADSGTGIPPIPVVDFTKFGPVEEAKLPRVQRAGGVNLHRSWLNLPHVTHFDEADITDLEVFRKSIKDDALKAGVRITPLAFIVKACARALVEFPKFNCSLGPNKDTLVLKRYYNIGVAVDTDNGLVVPVVKDVDRKGVYEIAREVVDLSDRARAGKLKPDEMSGGTFSITSLGVLGGTGFTPIINAPEVAILGVAKLATRPVWNGSAFVPRELLPLCLSYDHRVINGADGARFTTYLMALLGDVRRLLL